MGAWGTGINQNDTFEDLLIEFMDLYNDNIELSDIPKIINEKNNNIINDNDECASFWFAMAMGQWKCGNLSPEVLNKVQEIYETNKGLDLWTIENGAEKGDFEKHKKAILKFIQKISTPNGNPIKRKKIIPRPTYFITGDCLAIKLSNGLYGAAYVIKHSDDPKEGETYIAFIDYFSKEKPSITDVINIRLLRHDYSGWPERIAIKGMLARSMTKYLKKIELLGSYNISNYTKEFLNSEFKHIPIYDFWAWSETDKMLVSQYEFNLNRAKDYENITIMQLISDNSDNHWYRLKGWYNRIKK